MCLPKLMSKIPLNSWSLISIRRMSFLHNKWEAGDKVYEWRYCFRNTNLLLVFHSKFRGNVKNFVNNNFFSDDSVSLFYSRGLIISQIIIIHKTIECLKIRQNNTFLEHIPSRDLTFLCSATPYPLVYYSIIPHIRTVLY